MSDWPRVELDPIARLHVLARALPHTQLRECVIDAPFEAVWSIAGDMERGVPRYELGIESVDVLERRVDESGERLRLRTHQSGGSTSDFEAVLRPGFCVMRSDRFDIGLAALPVEGESRTHFAHYEGMRGFGRLLRPVFWAKIGGDLKRIERLARAAAPR